MRDDVHRRKRGTGTVYLRDGWWIGLAPQHRRGEKQLRVAKEKTKSAAGRALDGWLNQRGRIVHRDVKPAKVSRRPIA